MNDQLMFILIFCGVWGLVGIVFLAVGQGMAASRRKRLQCCTERVWGRVVDILPHYGHEGGVTLSPMVEYETPQGLMRQCSSFSSSRCRYAIGQQVTVWYDPQDPSLWYMEEENASRLFTTIFTAVGILCLLVAFIAASVMLSH